MGRVSFHLPSSMVLSDLRLTWRGRERLNAKEVALRFRLRSLFSETIEIESLTVENPSLWLRRYPDGTVDLFRFLSQRPLRKGPSRRKILIHTFSLQGGEVELLDGWVEEAPYPIRLSSFSMKTENILLPPRDHESPVTLQGLLGGGDFPIFASLKLTGWVNPEKMDFHFDVALRNLYLPVLNPYLHASIPMGIESGKMALDGEVRVEAESLRGVGLIHVRELSLRPSTSTALLETVFGISQEKVVAFLADADGELLFPVRVSGHLKDPKFELGELLTHTIRQSLARTLQKGVGEMVKTSSEAFGVADVGQRAKKVFKELEKTLRLDWFPSEILPERSSQ